MAIRQIFVENARVTDENRDPVKKFVSPNAIKEHDLQLYLLNFRDKVLKLEKGEYDTPEKKAELIRIATNNLGWYFDNGGKPNGFVNKDKKGKAIPMVTAEELMERFEPFQR